MNWSHKCLVVILPHFESRLAGRQKKAQRFIARESIK
jgi:hypothetical protein